MGKKEIPRKTSAGTTAYVERVQELVARLARLMENCNEMCLAQLDVTVAQGYAVMCLPPDGDVTMNALSADLGTAGSTATRMIDQLVRKRLASRRRDPDDRRVVRVALTRRGQQLCRALGEATGSCFMGAFAEVSEARRAGTIEALELIVASFAKSLEVYGCNVPRED